MSAIHWTCQCGEQGSGFVPADCPRCGDDPKLNEDGLRAVIKAQALLKDRAENVAILLGFGYESVRFESDSFEVVWEERACSRGCCGYETHTEELPLRYLWMADVDIKTERLQANIQAVRAKEEAERLEKLKKAEAQVAAAKAKAATAQADAERALAKAAEELATLQGGSRA
jgi:hypothetical protein